MKKLLYQFDTDTLPSVFDNVVGYDGGADHISAYGGVNADNVGGLVEGAIFTRPPQDKKNTALFVGGSNMHQGEALLGAIRAKFFAKFRVSIMFDCNGANTTAAAAVAWLGKGRALSGKRAVVLAGSGPVGQRAALLLAREGANVAVTGRKRAVVQAACDAIKARFGITVEAIEAATNADRAAAIQGAHIVLATGASGVTLLDAKQWQENPSLELIADANASPPAGIEGVRASDRGTSSHGKILFGALGFGALKLAVHRACIARLFEQNDLVLDAEEIYSIAKGMVPA
jgi:methylenetetrahydrofolate/methylenetetrahydromethanopterin dehydrogenase (NADP+)